MAITGFDEESFGKKLNKYLFPSQPIESIEHLFGREEELKKIRQAFYAGGRSLFVYGDRGVGKSSLAATAANQYQSSDSEYIDIACSPQATLASVIANVAYQSISASRLRNEKTISTTSLDLKYLKQESGSEVTLQNLSESIKTVTDAIEVLREVSLIHSETPIVVVDEFDRMKSKEQRNLFSDLIKQIGDKRINIKFIFTGVATSIDEMLTAHASSSRQLETMELPKLSWEARWDIANSAADAFNIIIPEDIQIRIAAISDGYPYYVHLMTEKLLWSIFEQIETISTAEWKNYYEALQSSIQSISAELKRPYETAINQRTGDYEEVLWATADSEWLQRYMKDMHTSYEYIMDEIALKKDPQSAEKTKLSYEKFSARVRNLKKKNFGEILISENSHGLYSYREKMLRGYVRIQAEAHGINLIGAQKKTDVKHVIKTPTRSKGYYTSSIPKGVHTGRRRNLN